MGARKSERSTKQGKAAASSKAKTSKSSSKQVAAGTRTGGTASQASARNSKTGSRATSKAKQDLKSKANGKSTAKATATSTSNGKGTEKATGAKANGKSDARAARNATHASPAAGTNGKAKASTSRSKKSAENGKSKSDNAREVAQLITLGKSKGFLTYDDVHDALPGDDVGAEQMDDVLSALGDEDIEVVDDSANLKVSTRAAPAESATTRKSAGKADRGSETTTTTTTTTKTADDDLYKSNDPVRMYLRKMGSVALLTREGEVEIAKRIEEGENEVLAAILNSPVAVREIIEIGEKLRNHKIRVKDIVRDAEDEEHEFDEEEADRRIIRLIDRVKRIEKKNTDQAEERKNSGRRSPQEDRQGARGQQEGARQDAPGDAPQQEDDRQDRHQAEDDDRDASSAPRARRWSSSGRAERPRPSSRSWCATPGKIPTRRRSSPRSSGWSRSRWKTWPWL